MKIIEGQSTSPPSGNLVDGLPLDCHTKTVAKRKSRRPRTTVLLTMKIMFLSVNASQSVLVKSKISLSYVLRLWMKKVRCQNANAGTEFYPHEISRGGATFEIFL